MNQQIALLSLTRVAHFGSFIGGNFTITIQAAGDTTVLQVQIPYGGGTDRDELLAGKEIPNGTWTMMPVNVSVQAMSPQFGGTGSGSTAFQVSTTNQGPYYLDVPVGAMTGPSATIRLTFEATVWECEAPCDEAGWYCGGYHERSVYYKWLCAGKDHTSFNQLASVQSLDTLLVASLPVFNAVQSSLVLNYQPSVSTLFQRLDYALDVTTAAVDRWSQLTWRRRYQINQFSANFVERGIAYLGEAVKKPEIEPPATPVCIKWHDLLRCLCAFNARRSTLPGAAVNQYDVDLLPHINALFWEVIAIAQNEGIGTLLDQNRTDHYEKVRYIAAFFEYWCRRCGYGGSGSLGNIEYYYPLLQQRYESLISSESMEGITLCEPTLEELCDRWLEILSCIRKLCDLRAQLPQGVVDDIVTTFEDLVASLQQSLMFLGGTFLPGIESLCVRAGLAASGIEKYICPDNLLPGGADRRDALEALLLQFESAMDGFIARNGDLCKDEIPVGPEFCDDWLDLLGCLKRICDGRREMLPDLRSAFFGLLFIPVRHLYHIVSDTPLSDAPAGIGELCYRIGYLHTAFSAICSEGVIDPILKLHIDGYLAGLQDALDELKDEYPDICAETLLLDPDFCPDMKEILACLRRVCDQADILHPSVLEYFLDEYYNHIDYLYWLVLDIPSEYELPAVRLGVGAMCSRLEAIQEYIDAICELEEADPIRKMRLEYQLGGLRSAHTAFLLRYPALCTPQPGYNCIDWLAMLDCLARLCDKRVWLERYHPEVITRIIELFGGEEPQEDSPLDEVFDPLFPTLPAPVPGGSIDRICYKVRSVLDRLAGHCVCGISLDPAQLGALEAWLIPFREAYQELMTDMTILETVHCDDADMQCDRFARIVAFHRLLCREEYDASSPAITAIAGLLQEFSDELPAIILQLGFNPLSVTIPDGSDLCELLDFTLLVLAPASADTGKLPVETRYRIDCFFEALRAQVELYAPVAENRPILCPAGECDDLVDRWLEIFICLCRICNEQANPVWYDTPEAGSIRTFIENEVCPQLLALHPTLRDISESLQLPVDLGFAATESCCLVVHDALVLLAAIGLRCDTLNYQGISPYELDLFYESMQQKMAQLNGLLAVAGLFSCRTECDEWKGMLECLADILLRGDRVSPALAATADSLFGDSITGLYDALYTDGPLDPPASSPVPPAAFGESSWKLLVALKGMYRLCAPWSARWSRELEEPLAALLLEFRGAYATFLMALDAEGITGCGRMEPECDMLGEIAEISARFCNGDADPLDAPVAVAAGLLANLSDELQDIASQLRLAWTLPSGNNFCVRLGSVLGLLGVDLSRPGELTASHRLLARFIFAILREQAAEYGRVFPERAGEPPAPMRAFRGSWMEMLDCICRTCEQLRSMPKSVLDGLTAVKGRFSQMEIRIDVLYPVITTQAAALGVGLGDLDCVNSSCGKLAVIRLFFALYGISAPEPSPGLVTLLAGYQQSLRAALALLRGALQDAGLDPCGGQGDAASTMVQSPHLYIQAAGSTGADGSVPGIHLRWALLEGLAGHLPKGDLAAPYGPYPADYGYNRPDDVVRLYRTPYDELVAAFPVLLDLTAMRPVRVYKAAGAPVLWEFAPIPSDPTFPDVSATAIMLRFADPDLYDDTDHDDPQNIQGDVQYILSHYTGVLDVQPIDKTLFVLDVTVAAAGADPLLEVETVSGGMAAGDDRGIISGRRAFHGNASPHRVINEGVQYARLRWTDCSPATISIQTYSDYYWGISRRYGWEEVGEFSLSLDRDEVYKRLEDREHFTVHKSWPKYQNDPADASGRGRVNVCNYRDRWDRNPAPHSNPEYACQDYERDPEDSLAFAVQEYLEKSSIPGNADPYVQRRSKLQSFTGDQAEIRLSLLQILNLAAQDYHVARMLGLGYIDWSIPSLPGGSGQRYIYAAEYIVAPRRGRVQAPSGKHLYLTLPTAQTDHRLPVGPSLATGTDPAAIEFGLPAFDADSAPMTDQEGYTPYGGARFIRLHKDALVFDLPASTPFFEGDEEFSRMEHTRPLFYGVTLHRLNGSEYERVWPEISNDAGGYERDDYNPYADASPEHYPETIGIPETTSDDGPFFIHHLVKPQEDPDPLVYQAKLARVEGTFNYGLYGINWFSRASEVNIHPEPVTTQFPKRNTIKPPLNLTAHHIQEEYPRIFISAYEAAHLDDLGGTTRVTFDWNHIQNAAYRRADLVEFFFRSSPPARVMGEIARVRELHGTRRVQVQTRSYTDYSVETDPPGGLVIEPAISSDDVSGNLFTGSLLATGAGKFVIADVARDGDGYAVFTLEMTAEDIGERRTYVAPKEGERFLVVENLADTGRWKPLPGCSIPLVSFSDHVERHVPAATGREVIDHVGGIYEPAAIVAAAVDGAYTITFQNPSGVLLPYHEYPEGAGSAVSEHLERVEWYGGSVRIEDTSGAIRTLNVVRIETVPGDPSVPAVPTVLHVAEQSGGGVSLAGTGTLVEFHPSYRAYLRLGDAGIDLAAEVLPAGREQSRTTFIAARAVDTTECHTAGGITFCHSSMLTLPVPHLARRIIVPQVPALPDNPLVATRPDYYGKSTYSFDVYFAARDLSGGLRDPYAMVFYRSSELDLLQALYSDTTVASILGQLPAAGDDSSLAARWRSLFGVETETEETTAEPEDIGTFRRYGGFGFPNPDRSDFFTEDLDNPGTTIAPFAVPPGETGHRKPADVERYIRIAIEGAFLPLTERPVFFDLVAEDPLLRTSQNAPVIRNRNGDLLKPALRAADGSILRDADPGFDPYPMVRRQEGEVELSGDAEHRKWRQVRFADYSLDGASRNIYFYCARELSNTMVSGQRSGMIGPVRLINTYPSVAPGIRAVHARPRSYFGQTRDAIAFEIAAYPASEHVERIRIYRAYAAEQAVTIRTMTMAGEVPLPADGIVHDWFAGALPHYGEPIYYRLTALRRIINEGGMEEYIESLPSETIVTNIVDGIAPAAPAISAAYDGAYPGVLSDVVLTWNPTTYNAAYHLFKMNERGNWESIHQVQSDTNTEMSYAYPDDLPTASGGKRLYHHFKVAAVNSSGLPSREERIVTLPGE